MQLLRMKREEKLDLILLARFLERRNGGRHGRYYAVNAGAHPKIVGAYRPRCAWLLKPENKRLRDGVIFYSKGWGWRVREDWREVVEQIEVRKELTDEMS